MNVFISWNIFSFQASGDHLPVAPPAPAHAQLATQQAANYQPKSYDLGNAAEFEDGQYDPRYNDPSFEGNGRGAGVQPSYVSQPSYAQQPIPQQQYVQPQPQPQPQAYNPANNVNIKYLYNHFVHNILCFWWFSFLGVGEQFNQGKIISL